jgi:hypothetical protein
MLPQWGTCSATDRLQWLVEHRSGPFGMGFFAFDVPAQVECTPISRRRRRAQPDNRCGARW